MGVSVAGAGVELGSPAATVSLGLTVGGIVAVGTSNVGGSAAVEIIVAVGSGRKAFANLSALEIAATMTALRRPMIARVMFVSNFLGDPLSARIVPILHRYEVVEYECV